MVNCLIVLKKIKEENKILFLEVLLILKTNLINTKVHCKNTITSIYINSNHLHQIVGNR